MNKPKICICFTLAALLISMLIAPASPACTGLQSALPGGTLDPALIPKYAEPLVIPPSMPKTKTIVHDRQPVDYYEIAVRQFQQQVLPSTMPETTVWGYGLVDSPETFNYPAFTIEAKWRQPVRVKWINDLKDSQGNYLPHLLPVDQTLHWANPPGGIAGRDSRPEFSTTPGPYTGPVPIVTHLHGAVRVGDESDGYAEAWYLPNANNIPAGYAKVGTWYNTFKAKAESKFGQTWDPGTAVFQYPNDSRAATLWYHDHTLGMTRLNVYAGPVGFYLLRGGPDDEVRDSRHGQPAKLPGPAPGPERYGARDYYEIPIAIQDKSFNADGSLFYPESRSFFDGITGPYIPNTDVPPIWNPEFFGNTMVVNGRTWPYLNVEQRRYRFRILNGCNSRFLIIKMSNGMPFWQIGTEAGFLPDAPVQLTNLLLGPAERADVIVDFSNVPAGTKIIMQNVGPDSPFGGFPIAPADLADPATTGQVMEFRVTGRKSADVSTPPEFLRLPSITNLTGGNARPLALLEMMSMNFEDAPVAALLGIIDSSGEPVPKLWSDPITENPAVGETEVWEFYNFTADAHPIHIHEIHFQVVNRQAFDTIAVAPVGDPRPPESWETGFKDTVIAYPGEITRVRGKFEVPGLFVWHCHILEHEDHEMMRPYAIGDIPVTTEP